MEASTSCSSPLSVHSLSLPRRPRLSAQFAPTIDCRNKSLTFLYPNLSSSNPYASSAFFKVPTSPFPSLQSREKRSPLLITAAFEKFTERAIKSVVFSQREAKALGKGMVFPQHLLLGLIAESGGDPEGFLGSGIDIEVAREVVRSIWKVEEKSGDGDSDHRGSGDSRKASDLPFSISTKRVFEAAVEYSRTMGYNFIAPEHVSVGLFTVDDGSAGRVLKRLGANMNQLAAVAVTRLQGELAKDGRESPAAPKGAREKLNTLKDTIVRFRGKPKDKSALARFCVDLTARAVDGLIDPIIGRDTEVQRIIQILCRRTKNNPILLGEAGVGKTAIAEGLAINIAQGNIPVFLLTKRIMSLDIGLLIAGAKERGELEARVTKLIKDVKKSGNVILFIDEVHTLIGSGTVGRGNKGLDIANLLKPSLGRGELQCIASTTTDEYRTYFDKDKALARRFQPVMINEPSQDDAVRILLGLREKYEAHHKCTYTLEALNAAVHLSARYIPDRHLPDKAIDLIDEAGSKSRMESSKRRKEQQTCILSKSPDDYWQEIRTAQAMHEANGLEDKPYGTEGVRASPIFRLSSSDYSILSCEQALAGILNEDDGASSIEDDRKLPDKCLPNNDKPMVVGPDEIAAVAALWSGIPVQKLTADERMLLVGLDELLKKRVVGQDEAVSAICRAVRRSRVGLKDPKRPIATMLFCGPTGVGKTELTKALAACYFGSEAAMLRLDMSEYMERHSVSKLIGSPPGYEGYGEGGTLTEAIRKRPFTVLLLDEIEKAHPNIFNILLQILEDGHLTNSQGRRVSFKNALIVMTSNVGSTAIAKGRRKRIGFSVGDDGGESTSNAGLKSLVMEELKGYFRPELLNRIDEVVVFHALEKAQMLEILNMMLLEVRGRLVSLAIGLEVSEAVMDFICKQGYDRSYGARPLRRAVTRLVEDPLSDAFHSGLLKAGDTAIIDLDDSGKPVVRNQSSRNIELSDTFL